MFLSSSSFLLTTAFLLFRKESNMEHQAAKKEKE
jgi:hypothetical protein